MKVLANEIIIYRNETFTIDKIIRNKDDSPYIISSEIDNPFLLVTLTTTQYEEKDRYVYNRWLDMSDFPRFHYTNAIDLKSFKNAVDATSPKYNDFSDITHLETIGQHDNVVAYGYVGDFNQVIYMEVGDCVFYVTDANGNTEYKYWDTESSGWKKYELRITTAFGTNVTSNFMGQSCLYSITLVGGNLNDSEEENKRPLKDYSVYVPILVPSKLTVMTDTLGGLEDGN